MREMRPTMPQMAQSWKTSSGFQIAVFFKKPEIFQPTLNVGLALFLWHPSCRPSPSCMVDHARRQKKVLIIDADPGRREAMRRMASEMGFEPIPAGSARDGFEKAFQIRPDLIILDLMLPNMGGFAVLTELKDHVPLARIPIIVLNASGEMASGSECMTNAAADFLRKECGVKVMRLSIRDEEADPLHTTH